MAYLSDTARVVLAAAAQRDDLSVLPFPDTVKAKGGAEQKVLTGLRKRGFVRVIETAGRPQRIVITSEGMAAIGVEANDESDLGTGAAGTEGAPAATKADTGATADNVASRRDTPAPAAEGDGGAASAKRKSKPKAAKQAKAASAGKPTPRTGTKQALMIEMLKRPDGATVEQIAKATGWQKHTIRGAISGALKKNWGSPSRRPAPARSAPTRAVRRAAARSTGSPVRVRARSTRTARAGRPRKGRGHDRQAEAGPVFPARPRQPRG